MFFTPVPEGVRHPSTDRHSEQRNTSLKSLVYYTVIQKETDGIRNKKSKLRLDPGA